MRLYTAVCGVAFAFGGLTACDDDNETFVLNVTDVAVSTAEDTPIFVRIPVRKNGEVTAEVTLQPMHGTLVESEPQNWMYTPAADYNGTDRIEVTFHRGPRTVVGAADITITPVNDAPVAAADSFAANFGAAVTIAHSTLLTNDTDIDNQAGELHIGGVIEGEHGTALMQGDQIVFTPEANFQGAATFQYVLSDGGTTTTGDVTVTVGQNNAPVAVNDTASVAEDGTLNVSSATLVSNDTDADQQTLAVSGVSNPTNGTVSLVGGSVRFVPAANFNGTATFEYAVTDGAASSTGTVTVTVSPVNDAPSASSDVANATEDTSLEIAEAALLTNDSDIDEDTLQITAVGGASNGSVSLAGGVVTFAPALNYNGLAGFEYTISDGTAFTTAQVTIQVAPVNDPPIAVDDSRGGVEDMPTIVGGLQLTMNDMDVDGDNLTVTAVNNATNGSVALSAGLITFTAPANYNGLATFEYTVSDGTATDTGLVTLLISAANDAPVANNDAASTTEDTVIGIAVLANDTDIDGDTLFIASVSPPAHGSVTIAGGTVNYLPAANYFGTDTFTYVARDAGGLQATAQVTVTIASVNDNPVAITDIVAMDQDTTFPIAVLQNDFDVDGDSVFLLSTTLPLHGTLAVNTGVVSYTPTSGYFGMDTFDYQISDGNGGTAQGVVTITIFQGASVCGDGMVTGSEECDPFIDEGTIVLGGGKGGGPTGENCNLETCRFLCASGTGAEAVAIDAETAGCYAVYTAPNSHPSSVTACATNGGHLVSVTRFSELLTSEFLTDNSFAAWLGASGQGSAGPYFQWITAPDEDFDFENWGSGAPDSTSPQCVLMNDDASWDDRVCTELHPYICEFEPNLFAHGSLDLDGELEFRLIGGTIADRKQFEWFGSYSLEFQHNGQLNDGEIAISNGPSSGETVIVEFGNDVTWGELVSALNSWATANLSTGVSPILTLTDPADSALLPDWEFASCDLLPGFQMPFFQTCFSSSDL